MTASRKRLLIAILVPIEVILAVLAWRDLGRRTDGEVRGSKRMWRWLVVVNPGNSMFYWLLGRRD
jgi:hypothetical protein